MGELLPSTCMHYDVRSRYLSNGISSKATLIQDIGRCAGIDKPKAKVYTGIDYKSPESYLKHDRLLNYINLPV